MLFPVPHLLLAPGFPCAERRRRHAERSTLYEERAGHLRKGNVKYWAVCSHLGRERRLFGGSRPLGKCSQRVQGPGEIQPLSSFRSAGVNPLQNDGKIFCIPIRGPGLNALS